MGNAARLDLYFCIHTGEEAFTPKLRDLFSRADVLVLENAEDDGLADLGEKRYRDLSDGIQDPDQVLTGLQDADLFGTDSIFFKHLFALIYGSHKQVCLERSPLGSEDIKRMVAWNLTNRNWWSKHYLRDYLRDYKNYLRYNADCDRARDKRFGSLVASLCRKHAESQLLVIRGAGHQRCLERFLRDVGIAFRSHLSDERISLFISLDVISKLAVEQPVSELELLMAAVQLYEIKERVDDMRKTRLADVAITYKMVTEMSQSQLEENLYCRSRGLPPNPLGMLLGGQRE